MIRFAIIVATALFAYSAAQVNAQPVEQDKTPPASLRSVRVVGGDPENAGEVPPNELVTRRLEFQNILEVPIGVEITSRTCACVTVKFEPESLAPGEKGVLTMSVVAAPVQEPQLQAVSFSVTWDEAGEKKTERGRCGVRYRAAVDYTIFPVALAVAGLLGERLAVDVVIGTGSEEVGRPELSGATCSLPGWKVARASDEELAPDTARFTISGPVTARGISDGTIEWMTSSSRTPRLSVPIRLRGLTAYRAFPGGATFVGLKDGETGTATLKLIPRRATQMMKPARVEVTPEGLVTAHLTGPTGSPDSVAIDLAPRLSGSSIGHATVRVVDADGGLLCEMPVVWCPSTASFQAATPPEPKSRVP